MIALSGLPTYHCFVTCAISIRQEEVQSGGRFVYQRMCLSRRGFGHATFIAVRSNWSACVYGEFLRDPERLLPLECRQSGFFLAVLGGCAGDCFKELGHAQTREAIGLKERNSPFGGKRSSLLRRHATREVGFVPR